MKKAKKLFEALLTLITVISLLGSLGVTAHAANVCSGFEGNSSSTRSFTVSTKSRFLLSDKITLKQQKGKMQFQKNWNGFGKSFLYDGYGAYTIQVQKISGGDKKSDNRTIRWNYNSSCTIKLQKNAEYRITVTPINNGALSLHYVMKGTFMRWQTPATWSVSNTKGISYCS